MDCTPLPTHRCRQCDHEFFRSVQAAPEDVIEVYYDAENGDPEELAACPDCGLGIADAAVPMFTPGDVLAEAGRIIRAANNPRVTAAVLEQAETVLREMVAA